ncbi:MAG: DUF177 domain-containing protein [Elusimicrobiota bacterium]
MSKDAGGLTFSVAEIRESQGMFTELALTSDDLMIEPVEDAKLADPVTAVLDFSVGGDLILLQATLTGAWLTGCSRCLVAHRAGFSAVTEETYPMDQETIDLGPELRDVVLTEVPQRSLCRTDCKGLCAVCGINLNEGACGCPPPAPLPLDEEQKKSPFAALKKFKTKD